MTIQSWLNKPYPLLSRPRDKGLFVLVFGIFTFLFLLLYQPFGTERVKDYQTLFLMGFGMSVSTSLSLTYFIVPLIFKPLFDQENWKIKNEIVYLVISFLVVSLSNYIYYSSVGAEIGIHRSFGEFIGISLSIGIFPLIIIIFLTELYLNRRNQETATELSGQIPEIGSEVKSQSLNIIPETTRSSPLNLSLEDFLFATSDNNYSTIFFLKNGKVSRELLRLSLKNLENQLAEVPSIVRCQRSYIVNKDKIQNFRGNTRSLTLVLEGYPERIPVSRSFPKVQLLT